MKFIELEITNSQFYIFVRLQLLPYVYTYQKCQNRQRAKNIYR